MQRLLGKAMIVTLLVAAAAACRTTDSEPASSTQSAGGGGMANIPASWGLTFYKVAGEDFHAWHVKGQHGLGGGSHAIIAILPTDCTVASAIESAAFVVTCDTDSQLITANSDVTGQTATIHNKTSNDDVKLNCKNVHKDFMVAPQDGTELDEIECDSSQTTASGGPGDLNNIPDLWKLNFYKVQGEGNTKWHVDGTHALGGGSHAIVFVPAMKCKITTHTDASFIKCSSSQYEVNLSTSAVPSVASATIKPKTAALANLSCTNVHKVFNVAPQPGTRLDQYSCTSGTSAPAAGSVSGYDISGAQTSCVPSTQQICTQQVTSGDMFRSRCENSGGTATFCKCHTYLCSLKPGESTAPPPGALGMPVPADN